MHAPDGFLNAGTAVVTVALSAGTLGVAMRQVKQTVTDRMIPLAGMGAAFVFAAQMFNFPVAAGTTGHLLGGALAAILLGPHLGAIVVTIVVVVQAFLFADGGITAIGYNVLNMAVIPAYGGYAAFSLLRRVLPHNKGGMIGATGLAAWLSVLLSAAAFSIEWLFGATAPVPFSQVFAAMVGVHVLIGVGEAVISSLAVTAVLGSRPDLVHAALDSELGSAGEARVAIRTFVIGGLIATLFITAIVSQFASSDPDGLESVAGSEGFLDSGQEHTLAHSLFADYATTGVANVSMSLAIAGIAGTVTTLLVAWGIVLAVKGKPPHTGGP
ncbi:MAG: energy-coupling factor ABC transporter permease [Acidimicrobiia bacterium]